MNIILAGAYSPETAAPAPVKIARILFNRFLSLGHSVDYVTYFDDGRKYGRLEKLFGRENISFHTIRLGIVPMMKFIIEKKPQLIQLINAESFYLFIFLLKPFMRFKIAYYNHSLISYTFRHYNNFGPMQTSRFRLIEFIVLHYSDLIFVFTDRDARYLKIYNRIKSSALRKVQHGANSPGVCKYDFKNYGVIKIVTVGSLRRKEKNLAGLLKNLADSGRQISLTVCTPDTENYTENIPANIELKIVYGLSGHKLMREFVRNDLFVLNSSYESFSLSLLEAMSAGMIFLVTNRTGLTEYFSEEFRMMIYPYKNNAVFLLKLNYLICLSAEAKNNLSEHIRLWAAEFTLEKSVRQVLENYDRCLSKSLGAAS